MDAGLRGPRQGCLSRQVEKGQGGRCIQEPNPDRKKEQACLRLNWGQDIEKDMEVLKQWIKDKKVPDAVEASVRLVPLECLERRALKQIPAAMLIGPGPFLCFFCSH